MTTAREFALAKHQGQTYGKVHDYSYHLDQVAKNLEDFGYTDHYLMQAAYLHDTMEDTHTSMKELTYYFGSHVTLLVNSVTAIGDTRFEKTQYTLDMLRTFPVAVPLKMADRLANMRFSRTEFDAGRPRKHIEVYTKELPMYEGIFRSCNEKMYQEMLKCCVS